MRRITPDEQKNIQMDILDAVDTFCTNNNIKYSIACGTMLGAIRHGGYIPWDDDIDIYMLRHDYQHFLKIFPKNYQGIYSLACIERTPNWHLTFAKVYDNRTLIKEPKMNTPEIGVNIDIFVIDNIPDDEEEWLAFNKKRRRLYRNIQLSSLKNSPSFPLLKNILICILRLRYVFANREKNVMRLSNFIQKYNSIPCKRVFETSSGMMCKRPFERTLFDDITYIPFEDRKYKGFRDYNSYLTAVYGPNYMTPPPPDKRASNHISDNFWK